jgi:fucose permease
VKGKPDNWLTAIAFVTFIGFGFNAGLMGVAWPSIRDAFGVGDDAFATVALVSLMASLVVTFYSGRLLDRFGVGAVLLVSFVIGSLGTVGYAAAPVWWMILLSRLIITIGTAPVNPGINTYFATHESAGRMNWLHACFGLGATVGPSAMTLILNAGLSWRWAYAVVATVDALLALGFALTLRRWPRAQEEDKAAEPAARGHGKGAWRLPAVWLSVALFFVLTGMEGASRQWPYTLFTEGRGVEPAVAGVWISGYWASTTVGRLFFGIVAPKIDSSALIRTCMGGAIVGATLVWASPVPVLGFVGLALIGLGLAPLFPVLMSNTPQRLGTEHAANAIGYQLTTVRLGVALFPALGGVLVENLGAASIGPYLWIISVVLFALHEVTLRAPKGAMKLG